MEKLYNFFEKLGVKFDNTAPDSFWFVTITLLIPTTLVTVIVWMVG